MKGNRYVLFLVFLLLVFPVFVNYSVCQTFIVKGKVTEINTGIPVPDQEVFIRMGGITITPTVNTDSTGNYLYMININPKAEMTVSTFDCMNSEIMVYFPVIDSFNMADFEICLSSVVCEADFGFENIQGDPLTIQFSDQSTGQPDSWYWNFSDGYISTEKNPLHTFYSDGNYTVSLSISDSAGLCVDSITKLIFIYSDTIFCQANFNYELDTLSIIPYQYNFYDISIGNPDLYFWDFGDGNSSNEKNPVHNYVQPGSYTVCLTIQTLNNPASCFSQICDSIETMEYFSFGGQVFVGDYAINIEENDSSNQATAYLFRRLRNQWRLMDQLDFWKYGYYYFLDKPPGEYIVRVDLDENSLDYPNYAPAYFGGAISWEAAGIFNLNSDNQFAVNVSLRELAPKQEGSGYISGKIVLTDYCHGDDSIADVLIQLMNSEFELVDYTYTNHFGEFRFDGLTDENYLIKPEYTGSLSYPVPAIINFDIYNEEKMELIIYCEAFIGLDERLAETDELKLTIYPVPADQFVYLDFDGNSSDGNYLLQLFSVSGHLVYEKSVWLGSGYEQMKIPVKSIKNGIYILHLTCMSNQNQAHRKIVITH